MKTTRRKLLIATVVVFGWVAIWWIPSIKPNKLGKATRTATPQANSEAPTPVIVSQSTPPAPVTLAGQEEAFITAFKNPINFYGRVIDQHGDPVSNAHVNLSANDKAFGGRPSHYTRTTDVNGLFSIKGVKGITLAVGVSKAGYRGIPPVYGKVTSSGLFEYGLSSRGPYQSSEDAPTIFTLHKIGVVEPLVKVGEKNFRLARDGSPLWVSLDQTGGHQIVFRCWNSELERPEGQQQYDWRLDISVPKGGLLARDNAFALEAPEGDYLPYDTIEMPASLPYEKWDSFSERSYFIRFDDGTFARANLRMRAGGDHFVVWESFYNPKPGSRNLEANPTK